MKKAFTLIELIFVIIVIGILSAVLAPSFKRNPLQEAADQIASHIRLTQQLALHDNKFNPTNSNWYKKRWQIRFFKKSSASKDGTAKWAYAVFSDKNLDGNPNNNEIAIDPLTNTYISGGFNINYSNAKTNKKTAIGEKFGISSVTFTGGCAGASTRISFDNLGRPLKGNPRSLIRKYATNTLITSICNIVLQYGTQTKTISIYPETGFVKIN